MKVQTTVRSRLRALAYSASLAVLVFASAVASGAEAPWREKLETQIPLLGHRNWIVVADAAYPWQTAPGIETVTANASQVEVVRSVLRLLHHADHVRPTVFTDAEMSHVPETDAKGITVYRDELTKLLEGRTVQSLPHEQIIAKLDEAGKTFHVLLIKTTMTLPYTSVFIQLDCGYWNADAEKRLRDALGTTEKK